MSTTTYARPLYAVPDFPTTTKAKFAALLYLRTKAQHAFNKAMSLPRSAIRWAVSLFQKWAETMASIGVFSWLGQQARKATGIIQSAGIVPVAVAVLSTPPIAAVAKRVARFVGKGLVRVASAAWSGLKGLLGRFGSTGARITKALAHAGAKVVHTIRAAAKHPVMTPIAHAARATMALVRPISQGFVAHRLLGVLVPILWLRTLIGIVLMPLLVDTALPQGVRDLVRTPAAPITDDTPTGYGADDAHATDSDDSGFSDGSNKAVLLIDTFATEAPKPTNDNDPAEGEGDEEDPPLNRAERRAQQRQDAQAKRPRR